MDILLPVKKSRICNNEPPWMNHHLKSLIHKRQLALATGNKHRFNHLRNAVNRERKKCRSKFYESKVKQFKSSHPKQWWKSIKALCGMNPVSSGSTFSHLIAPSREPNLQSQSLSDLANTINQTFLSPMERFQPLCSTTPLPITTCNSESMASALVITESQVFTKLVSIKSSKAPRPDSIPGWLLKENACALAEPISEILNSSYYENKLPSSWKMADVSPIPKQKPVQDISKHLRPISLTPVISKLAEEFVVDRFIKPAILQIVDSRQYGVIPKSSTTQSLIGLVHNLAKATDGSGALVRVVMFDYKKAFDLIDHHILVTKLHTLDIPPEIINWVSDFLTNRQQRVKLASDCYSEWAAVPAGVPQGTKLGPWLYILMINDLNANGVDLWKFVDDTTIAEEVPKGDISKMQLATNEIQDQSINLKFTLNEDKCKEMRVCFTKLERSDILPLVINNKEIELTFSAKILGLIIRSDLKWNDHVESVLKKSSKRLYFLRQLKRARVSKKEMILFFCTCVRLILEYASPVFHYSLPSYLSNDIERIQRRALKITYPSLSYQEALVKSGLQNLHNRRDILCRKTFKNIVEDPNHKLHSLLPPVNDEYQYNLRNKRFFRLPKCKTNRFENTFMIASASQY